MLLPIYEYNASIVQKGQIPVIMLIFSRIIEEILGFG